jgi:hypothetical protein
VVVAFAEFAGTASGSVRRANISAFNDMRATVGGGGDRFWVDEFRRAGGSSQFSMG